MIKRLLLSRYKHFDFWLNIFLFVVLLFFLFLLIIQHNNIFNIADDFCRKLHSASFVNIFTASLKEYREWTGRFIVSILSYFFATEHLHFWKILNPLVIVSLVICIVNISKPAKTNPIGKVTALCFVIYFFLTLNQYLAREVLYWMTGTINYLWPLTNALAFVFFFEKSFGKSKFAIYSKYISLFIGIFSGNSNEQIVIVFLFLTFSVIWNKLKQGYKLDKIQLLTIIIFVLSFLLLMLSPGNFMRFSSESDGNKLFYSSGIISKFDIRLVEITSVIYYSQLSEMFFNLFGVISLLLVINLLFSKIHLNFLKKFTLILIFGWTVFMSFIMKPNMNLYLSEVFRKLFGTFSISGTIFNINTLTTYLYWVILLISMLYFGRSLFKQGKSPYFYLSIVGAILSQAIMLLFPYSPYRTFFITTIFIVIAINYLIQLIASNFLNILAFLVTLILLFNGLTYYQFLISNYRANKHIMIINENLISEYKNKGLSHLALNRLTSDLYSNDLPYVLREDWETPCFKNYYGLEDSLEITWIP